MLFLESIFFSNLGALRVIFFVKFKFYNKGTQFPSSMQLLLNVIQTRFAMKLNMVCRLPFPRLVM